MNIIKQNDGFYFFNAFFIQSTERSAEFVRIDILAIHYYDYLLTLINEVIDVVLEIAAGI